MKFVQLSIGHAQLRHPASVDEVGRGIAGLYVILYGETNEHIERAGLLRAQAGRVRDETSDWPEVRRLLEESYGELLKGIEGAQAETRR